MARKLSGFERMWNVYPAPTGEAEAAKAAIGGGVDVKWITNTCVIRLSRALNYAGHLIPAGQDGLATLSGADGLRYAYRVEEFRKYLVATFGSPTFSEDHDPPREGVPDGVAGRKGILCFRVTGWDDATGHIDLWDGEAPRHAAYFSRAATVMLWTVESLGSPRLATGGSPVPLTASVGHGGTNNKQDIARVQSLLAAFGLDPGDSDGVLGPRTQQAIVDFQRQVQTPTDGRIDPNGKAWRALNGL